MLRLKKLGSRQKIVKTRKEMNKPKPNMVTKNFAKSIEG
jgi:hypothetical protein